MPAKLYFDPYGYCPEQLPLPLSPIQLDIKEHFKDFKDIRKKFFTTKVVRH